MERRTSRPSRGFGIARRSLAFGVAVVMASASAVAQQEEPSRPPPGLSPSRPAPGLDLDRRSEPPGFDLRPAPEVSDPNFDTGKRYRFIESYGDPRAPGDLIGSFQVAFVESLDRAFEVAGAAPQRTRLDYRVVYVGRPSKVSGLEGRDVSALIRQYQSVNLMNDGVSDSSLEGPAGLTGQAIWLEDEGRPTPTVLTLPGAPALTQEQFAFASYQQVFVPRLAGVLPPQHVGVGSRWPISKKASEAIVGDLIQNGLLEATFEEIVPPGEGETTSRAVIGISGRVQLSNAMTAVNGQLEFAYTEPVAAVGEAVNGPQLESLGPKLVDVRGAVVRFLLAQRDVSEMLDGSGRVAQRATQLRELNLERRLTVEGSSIPSLPDPPLVKSPENSWVTYRDSSNRFLFRHPQDYRPAPEEMEEGEAVLLKRVRVDGVPDNLTFVFYPRGEVPPETHPDPFVRAMVDSWRAIPPPGVTVGRGTEGFLPETGWDGKRVFRVELPLSYRPNAFVRNDVGQAYSSGYLVQASNGAVLTLMTLTEGQPNQFREEVEMILKSFQVDPPGARPSGRGASPRVSPTEPEPATEPPPVDTPEPDDQPESPSEVPIPPIDPGSGLSPIEPSDTPPPPPIDE